MTVANQLTKCHRYSPAILQLSPTCVPSGVQCLGTPTKMLLPSSYCKWRKVPRCLWTSRAELLLPPLEVEGGGRDWLLLQAGGREAQPAEGGLRY